LLGVDADFDTPYLVDPFLADNFATGGANTDASDIWGIGLGLQTQIGLYAGAGRTFSDTDLAVVWAGANDYLFGGVTDPYAVVGDISAGLVALNSLGAQHMLVMNMPNLGMTPLLNRTPYSGLFNDLSAGHNQLLEGSVANLRTGLGVEIIYVDVETALDHILASPALFNFSNSTDACLSMPEACFVDPDSFVFWDDIHPTAATHELLAEFTYATLLTTRDGVQVVKAQASVAALTSMAGLRAAAARQNAVRLGLSQQVVFGNRFVEASPIEQRLALAGRSDSTSMRAGLSSDGMPAPAIESPFGMYMYGATDDGEQAATVGQAGFGYHTEQNAIGMDYRLNESLMIGMIAGFSEGESILAGGAGSSSVESSAFTIYGSLNGENGHIDASVGQSRESYAGLTRNTGSRIFPTARADTEGLTVQASLSGGYDWHAGPVTWGPVAGLEYSHRQVEGYRETGAGPLNLTIAEQTDESLVGSIGLRTSGESTGEGSTIVMQGGRSYEQDLLGDSNRASAQLAGNAAVTDITGTGGGSVMKLDAGVGVRLDGGVTATLENSLELTDGGDPKYAGMAWVKLKL
jgi:outer membrane lipase/esterase